VEKNHWAFWGDLNDSHEPYLNVSFPTYFHRAYDHVPMMSKARFIQLALNYGQHSNTPVLQYSGLMLSVRLRIIDDLTPMTRFLILE
jgi:hypothetical protein